MAFALVVLGGCANFSSVSDFANHTTQLTSAVRAELSQIARICDEQAELRIVVTGESTDALLDGCRRQGSAVLGLQTVTVDVIDLYGRTLNALVDGTSADMAAYEGAVQNLASLSATGGEPIARAQQTAAAGKVLDLLADVVLQHRRDEGIRRLVAAGPDLVSSAGALREFFLAKEGASAYDRWLEVVQSLASRSSALLAVGTPLARQEPIRSAELRRAIARTAPVIDERRGPGAGTVPRRLAVALDEWIATVLVFEKEALQADPKALLQKLASLGRKAAEARRAVEAGFGGERSR